ncbi:MAG: flagellar motor protein MotB [Myxococcota bacterium]
MDDDHKCPDPGAPAWMATFSDMMSLLFVFFVLLLSFATMDATKFRDALGSVQEALGVQFEHPGDVQGMTTSVVEMSQRESTSELSLIEMASLRKTSGKTGDGNGEDMVAQARQMVKGLKLGNIVEVVSGSRGVTIRVKGQVLFEPGTTELRAEAFPLLDEIIALTRAFPYHLTIEGHTDDTPVSPGARLTNWEISTRRAIAALRYFEEVGHIEPARLACAGYAGTRPIAPNDSAANRAANRRVEFTFTLPIDFEEPPVRASAGDADTDGLDRLRERREGDG